MSIDPAAKQLLESLAQRHRALKSYSATVLVRSNGETAVRSTTEIALQNPNRLRVIGSLDKKTQTALTDGTKIYTLYSVEKKWYQERRDPKKTILQQVFTLGDPTPLAILRWLLTEPSAVAKILAVGVTELKLGPEEKLAELPVTVFELTIQQGKNSGAARFLFGKDDGLLRRIRLEMLQNGIPTALLIDVTQVKANPSLPAPLFQFSPPKGYRQGETH